MRLINIGYGNMVAAERVIAAVSPDAAPIRRLVQDARDAGRVIDATCGHKTKSVLMMDSDHIVLSAVAEYALLPQVTAQEYLSAGIVLRALWSARSDGYIPRRSLSR